MVNNAGVITRGRITETTDADWALALDVNVEAPFRICRAAIPLMAAAPSSMWPPAGGCGRGRAMRSTA
ncbi:Short-chain dehydrogenase/reductase SDR (plasmid) [Cereibacter sphaeroides KD131]|nr:Short-chain dehydrogenase/reductase SDR [Cereibacter sphaeroides KD131]